MTQTPPSDHTLTPTELEQIDAANDSGRQPVVFIHGLWLLSSSWDRWRTPVRGRRLRDRRSRLARRPRDRRRGARQPRGVRPQDGQAVTDHYLAAIAKLTASRRSSDTRSAA